MGRSGYFSLNLSANSVMRGRLDARRTLKSLVADLRNKKNANDCTISGIMRYHLINAWAHQWKRVINNGKSAG
ncbi:hypothetical protein DW989_16365 [Bacteroides stercoris]|nr:hypothetical protein DW989_16365 [Bacteroides stercoris]